MQDAALACGRYRSVMVVEYEWASDLSKRVSKCDSLLFSSVECVCVCVTDL